MSIFGYKSRIVHIGSVSLGGDLPIVLQSMTSTDTMDTIATVEQSIRMIDAGCEMVRITAPGIKEAENLRLIKKELANKGYNIPLIADIHYQPKAAIAAAEYIEKVRINPGNYVDRKRGKISYTTEEYQIEIDKIKERFKPLMEVCKKRGIALRIGSNHGSLSERILLKYGDTPSGMVESAIEFIKICEDFNFMDIILSMKASNVKIMVQANRLLVKRMMEEGMDYPIHLGVTEAGDAEDGRMKSAAGIGPLIMDGVGNTIRVSLTEDPEFEIPVAQQIIEFSESNGSIINPDSLPFDLYKYKRRESLGSGKIGNNQPPVVIVETQEDNNPEQFKSDFLPDYYSKNSKLVPFRETNEANSIIEILQLNSIEELEKKSSSIKNNCVIVFNPKTLVTIAEIRNWFAFLNKKKIENPVVLKRNFTDLTEEDLIIKASVEFAYFLVDGLLDGIWLESNTCNKSRLSEIAFGILQATGERISKTEYIACPSCGRTLFKIQNTLQIIKERTKHLKGLKIGVMGCCVNGPGEMADADYGYVGAGKGKITLYRGQQIVKQGVLQKDAVDELINIIKNDGKWKEKSDN